jgi:glycosyltransferase involved in cell wall biosynthesis
MQKTNFRFEAIIHDDASTDGTTEIIREYAEKYPSIIKPIFETENQYSKHDGSIGRIMDEHTHGKYVATCEGDDYWIDPHKLQKQFDFMESHPECSMCFHSNFELYPSGVQKLHCPKNIKTFYNPEDIILGGGGFMATNSMFYRWSLLLDNGRPDFWKKCPIGDLPRMLFFVSKGNIGYINEPMSIYRISAINSWTSRQKSLKARRNHHKAILRMFDEFDEYTNYQYHNAVSKKKRINKKFHRMDVITSMLSRIKKFLLAH